jgi:hypothetical protein
MKQSTNKLFTGILLTLLMSSCSNLSTEVETKLLELKSKTESLDSMINKEADKVLQLDSLVNLESDKVKKLDTLIHQSASQLDSITQKGRRFLGN